MKGIRGLKVSFNWIFWIKISLSAICATLLAIILKLDFAFSAGIVAILSVQTTKKETVKTALSRFVAFLAALGISWVCFTVIGFSCTAFFIYLIIFVALCLMCGWNSAMAMDSVLISHFMNFGKMGLCEVKNEILLFCIGVGCGVVSNIFLRKRVDIIEQLKTETDNLIKQVLHRMSLRIMDVNLEGFDGSCFVKLEEALFRARKQSEINFNNQFGKDDVYDIRYILMRQEQISVLREMYKSLSGINTVPVTAKVISDFLEKISVEYHKENDVTVLLREHRNIKEYMKIQPLPDNRSEFENRANLFVLLQQIEEFLQIKNEFMTKNRQGRGVPC